MSDTDILLASRPAPEAWRSGEQVTRATTGTGGTDGSTLVATNPAGGAGEPGTAQRLVPVALSGVMEGLGQAWNRQPVKAAALTAAGLGLSTASGLNTWLARRVTRSDDVTIGTSRIRPWLLGAWAATYGYALWDAWASSRSRPHADG